MAFHFAELSLPDLSSISYQDWRASIAGYRKNFSDPAHVRLSVAHGGGENVPMQVRLEQVENMLREALTEITNLEGRRAQEARPLSFHTLLLFSFLTTAAPLSPQLESERKRTRILEERVAEAEAARDYFMATDLRGFSHSTRVLQVPRLAG